MLTKRIGITVRDYKISMTSPLKFYEDDDLELCFQISEFGATVLDEDENDMSNATVIFPEKAILFVETPDNIDTVESTTIENDEVHFRLTNKYTNIDNVGKGRMQIVLFDGDSRKAIPPFQFEIQPIIYKEKPDVVYDGLMDENGIALCTEDMMLLESSDEVYGIKISALEETIVSEGYVPIVQNGVTMKYNLSNFANELRNNSMSDMTDYIENSILPSIAMEIQEAKEEVKEEVQDSIDSIGSEIMFDNDMTVVSALGGIKVGESLEGMTVKEILEKMLFPYVAPTVSASLGYSPIGTIFERGEKVTISSITGSVTKKSENIVSVRFLDGVSVLKETKVTENQSSYTFTYLFPNPITITASLANTRFRFAVTDATQKTYYANTVALTFVFPYFMGVINNTGELTSDVITQLTKKVETKGTKSYSFTTKDQMMVFAYPTAYGDLKSIKDPNDFENIGSFKKQVIYLDINGGIQGYNVYYNESTTLNSFVMTFYY